MAEKTIRVATDVGGTFTDLVAFETDEKGVARIITAKSDTTPPNFEQGVLNVLDKAGLDPSSVDFLAHGTTVVINALTERKGVKVGLITTEGFRDTLEIARGNRPDFFNLHYEKPEPFVPRYLRRELPGRMSYRGEEMAALELSGLQAILDDFKADGVEAVAISFLHSYANPEHEQAVLAKVKELWPEVSAVASHQITREWREYERTNTAVLSAYVQPIAERYLSRLAGGLKDKGFDRNLYIMQSNCGVESLDVVTQIPITMVESGPASGFWGAAELGKLIGEPNVLALDIGGTTAKCSLIEDGQVKIMTDYWIERERTTAGYPIMVPVVDLVEIGNGGGSIAWVDDFGKLHVGPQSAGAAPGPAAYGRGGTNATTTDANLWLGRINRDYFCGGEVEADMASTEEAITTVGEKLGVDAAEAARGIIRIANNNMVNALKLVSLNRGHDPRDFTLVAFGGGGAMHAVALAAELGVRKVVVPAAAAVFSAWGMMMSDLRRDYFVTRLADLKPGAAAGLETVFAETEARARAQFEREGVDAGKVKFLRYGKFRYQNQEHTTEVLLEEGAITDERLAAIEVDFHETYEREYTYRLDAPVEMVGIHLVASAEVGKLTMAKREPTGADTKLALKGQRSVDYALEGVHEASIYDGTKLESGMTFTGPAIVEDPGTTTVIHPGNRVEVDGYGNLHIHLKG
ncbi:hydantoinase/oxoprolinase family protein [Nitratireductor sp. L1-7-SE]|uniref:Hydantoinase/oxoprolinase family protein n=1 Tax=Nitratireductor rhodophyticola TaxID=2854036 RepID=A0ABS7R8V2_9HYPH|nr:hydantoinase/oxoprolinase family protein [Nitratireductor rhodophyticola]MBY8917359.1 hydantoinase/oxoprolinase family protein [Nitratireductor rhodophyticola]MBY8920212.1 hydantoinase/oxoprolinase family protein [Nitratireductor rhodophyticola]